MNKACGPSEAVELKVQAEDIIKYGLAATMMEPRNETTDGSHVTKVYQAGTLQYTLRGLIVLFAWLLWGDFCFVMFESIFGRFIPLYLKDLNASNTLIGVMTGSIAGAVNILFLPHISMASDRYRSLRGRRIPFLFWATPCTVASLILIGYAPEIGGWLHARVFASFWPGIGPAGVILTTLCVFVVLYHFFNMVLVNIFNCLLRDVVPQEVMARFLSSFRIMGTLGGFIFSWYLFQYVLDHRKMMCVGVGLIYLVAFLFMCWRVKEGDYELPPVHADRPGFLKTFATYFRECLSIPFYRDFFIAYVLLATGVGCTAPFAVLFVRDTLGISMEDIGKVFAWASLAGMLVYPPMGWLCDRFNPLRVILASMLGMMVVSALSFFLIHDKASWLVWSLVGVIPSVGWGLASVTASMVLFPAGKFGQFSSGLNVLGCGGMILANYLIGKLIDATGSNYRMIYLWSVLFCALALAAMLRVYRGWKQHGGPHHYVPPMPE
jgi:MFS family permease